MPWGLSLVTSGGPSGEPPTLGKQEGILLRSISPPGPCPDRGVFVLEHPVAGGWPQGAFASLETRKCLQD